MEFCDKLQKIRKENNITQEQLADKLNVSRQAVSKWESGTAYPDTEKLIQISKIFNVTLDELINDKKSDTKKEKEKEKKVDFLGIFDDILNFISKSVNMFWSMKFGEKIKCLFELFVLVILIIGVSAISTDVISGLVHNILNFLPGGIIYTIRSFVEGLLYTAWIIIGVMIVVKVFKSRYLDYYVVITDDTVKEKTIEEPIKELKDKKEYKIVIRDPKDSNLGILKGIGKIIGLCLKCLSIIVIIPIIMTFIFLMITFVISLFYLLNGLFFNGITLAVLGALLFTYLVIEIIYTLICNRTYKYQRIFIMFITSISLVGIGLGISFNELTKFTFVHDSSNYTTTNHTLNMKDDLVFLEIDEVPRGKIVIDNNKDDIELVLTSSPILNVVADIDETSYYEYDDELDESKYYSTNIVEIYSNYDEWTAFKKVIDGFKEKKIVDIDNYGYQIEKITISEDNLNKIIENNKKYLD